MEFITGGHGNAEVTAQEISCNNCDTDNFICSNDGVPLLIIWIAHSSGNNNEPPSQKPTLISNVTSSTENQPTTASPLLPSANSVSPQVFPNRTYCNEPIVYNFLIQACSSAGSMVLDCDKPLCLSNDTEKTNFLRAVKDIMGNSTHAYINQSNAYNRYNVTVEGSC